MDYNSPLFLAHQNARRAEILMTRKCYEDALDCHKRASEYIQHAMTLTKVSKSLESLSHQQDYHSQQINIIRAKKLQVEIQENIQLLKKKKMEKKSLVPCPEEERKQALQNDIFQAMEEADSLLGLLTARQGSTSGPAPLVGSPETYMKHPKDDRTVIEELRTVNSQLRALVTQLLSELDSSRREIESLRERLTAYTSIPELAPLEIPKFDYTSL